MSLLWHVACLIADKGPATPDKLLPLCPGVTRHQVHIAFRNASNRGYIHFTGERIGRACVYAAGAKPEPDRASLINSVFQLGSRL